ncbi:MAG: hypothetical protein LBD44_01940 [Spirochaetaceae bacterium]|jgi:hypothetical protein|nr:hypothetical protein [Spirochaetaceae bacterium]
MLRKSLIIVFATLVGLALVFTGCEKEVVKEVPGSGWMMLIDTWASGETALTAALVSKDSKIIGTKAAITLTSALTVPAEKTLVIFAELSGKPITVEGKVYVGSDGNLIADSTNTIMVKGAGAISVEKGGKLTTDEAASVNNGATTPATVMGKAVTIVGGKLKLSPKVSDAAAASSGIATALGYISSGILDLSGATITTPTGFTPSFILAIPGVSATKALIVNAGDKEPDATTALTIKTGYVITADKSDTLAKVTNINVSDRSGFMAEAATGDATNGITVTVGETSFLQLGSIGKLKDSKVAAGGNLEAKAVVTFDASAKLAVSADAIVNNITFVGATNITALTADAFTIDSYTVPEKVKFAIPASKIFTVTKALEVNGTLSFGNDTSKVILGESASLKAGASGIFSAKAGTDDGSGIDLSVAASTVLVTSTGFTSNDATAGAAITLTTATAGTDTPTGYIIGNASFAINNATSGAPAAAVTSTTAGTGKAAAGEIKAGTGTAITLVGKK